MTKVATLKPELEFEVIKVVILREKYLNRLRESLKSSNGNIDLSTVGLFDTLRDASVNVVETIRLWEQSQIDYPHIKPFVWNGQGYLQKMIEDTGFLSDYPQVEDWLEFTTTRNPFFVPPELLVYDLETSLERNSYVVFGKRPVTMAGFAYNETKQQHGDDMTQLKKRRKKAVKLKSYRSMKSPYNTNIINDPDVIPAASMENQLKGASRGIATEMRVRKDSSKTEDADIYETFIQAEMARRIRKSWSLLCAVNADLQHTFTGMASMSNVQDDLFATGFVAQKLLAFEDESGEAMTVYKDEREALGSSSIGDVGTVVEVEAGTGTRIGRGTGTGAEETTSQTADDVESLFTETAPDLTRAATLQRFRTTLKDTSVSIVNEAVKEIENEALRIRRFNSLALASSDLNDTHHQPYQQSKTDLLRLLPARGGSLSVGGVTTGSQTASLPAVTRIWTPHEINMQKMIQRRGGELYILTAAGTKGRVKAPWRRNRFQRLEADLESALQQENCLNMAWEEAIAVELPDDPRQRETAVSELTKLYEVKRDVEVRRRAMSYLLHQVRRIITGSINMQKIGQMHQLNDGEALESDERQSMALEDLMARKIQRAAYIKFGRVMRAALRALWQRTSIKLQRWWYRVVAVRVMTLRSRQLRLALLLQALWAKRKGYGGSGDTVRALIERKNAIVIQRVARGFMGRIRLKKKRIFNNSIDQGFQAVSPTVLTANEILETAQFINNLLEDVSKACSTALLSVLRGILFLLNGDEPEMINIYTYGIYEPKCLYGQSLSWKEAYFLLLRKGKFLRRIRGLARHIKEPNPFRLALSKACIAHVKDVDEHMSEADFDDIPHPKVRSCAKKLLRYVQCMKRVQELQHLFPQYFNPSQPGWFRLLLGMKRGYEKARIEHMTLIACEDKLNAMRDAYMRDGKR